MKEYSVLVTSNFSSFYIYTDFTRADPHNLLPAVVPRVLDRVAFNGIVVDFGYLLKKRAVCIDKEGILDAGLLKKKREVLLGDESILDTGLLKKHVISSNAGLLGEDGPLNDDGLGHGDSNGDLLKRYLLGDEGLFDDGPFFGHSDDALIGENGLLKKRDDEYFFEDSISREEDLLIGNQFVGSDILGLRNNSLLGDDGLAGDDELLKKGAVLRDANLWVKKGLWCELGDNYWTNLYEKKSRQCLHRRQKKQQRQAKLDEDGEENIEAQGTQDELKKHGYLDLDGNEFMFSSNVLARESHNDFNGGNVGGTGPQCHSFN
ncbi:hypothetical protein BDA99DRAFT_557316 [Phascolomyces articulosus]|uniref:Uncharacterized protein n=1 Tax=Phascolomyces articulosus TaxID=60185 RepID=A0AAD5KFH0_9FUNG|nr:hypothetical protein BDA99DRAFT_557316 [Phascolomyces articulosus]